MNLELLYSEDTQILEHLAFQIFGSQAFYCFKYFFKVNYKVKLTCTIVPEDAQPITIESRFSMLFIK